MQNCGKQIKTIEGVEVTKKFYLVKGLKNHDQTFNATQPEMTWNQDWGICGKVEQKWLESDATYVNWPSVEKAVPVVVLVGNASFEYEARDKVCPSGFSEVSGICTKKRADDDGVCNAGETRNPPLSYVYKSRGAKNVCPAGGGGYLPYVYTADEDEGSKCVYKAIASENGGCAGKAKLTNINRKLYCIDKMTESYPSCGSGWSVDPDDESQCRKVKSGNVTCDSTTDKILKNCPSGSLINPSNSNQCRRSVVVKVPDIDVDDPPEVDEDEDEKEDEDEDVDDPGGGGKGYQTPPWCKAEGDSWDEKLKVCNYAEDPGFECGKGLVWDSSSDKCISKDGYGDEDGDGDGEGEGEGEGEGDGEGEGEGEGEGQGKDFPLADEFFKDAPVANDNFFGSKAIPGNGFYSPTYGENVSFISLIGDSFSKNKSSITTSLSGIKPPAYLAGGLPKVCIEPNFGAGKESLCIDFKEYSFVFDFIKMMFWFLAVVSSYKIIIGAK